MRIGIVGSGYVGLVVGTCFAHHGNSVICMDKDERKIAMLNKGQVPFYEPGLDSLIQRNAAEGRLTFTTDMQRGIDESDIIFIAVGTPPEEDGSADLQHVLAVADAIGRHMRSAKIVVTKSTVPVGTAYKIKAAVQKVTQIPVKVASNPEFLKEGDAVNDFMKPDRIVVGYEDEEVREAMAELYRPFESPQHPIIFMDIFSSELTKYAANAMLATRISFMNDLSRLCEKVGADVELVRQGIGTDKRIGPHFLKPGIGYGGSCFPKDVKAIIYTAKQYDHQLQILESVEAINKTQKTILCRKIEKHFQGAVKGKRVAVWGLAFKPETDDMREAPSVEVINWLLAQGATVTAYDPVATETAHVSLGDTITYAKRAYDALDQTDALVIATEWNEFQTPDFDRMKRVMHRPVIFDGRNLYQLRQMKKLGFTYYSVGRNTV